jgi:hypothetical protein
MLPPLSDTPPTAVHPVGDALTWLHTEHPDGANVTFPCDVTGYKAALSAMPETPLTGVTLPKNVHPVLIRLCVPADTQIVLPGPYQLSTAPRSIQFLPPIQYRSTDAIAESIVDMVTGESLDHAYSWWSARHGDIFRYNVNDTVSSRVDTYTGTRCGRGIHWFRTEADARAFFDNL